MNSIPNSGVELNVFLRGQRNYVQGTQLVARACEALATPEARLIQATFSRITTHGVRLLPPGQAAAPGEQSVGILQVETEGASCTCALVESAEPAPRQDLPMTIALTPLNEKDCGPLRGRYAFAHDGSLEGLLNVMVQSVKALHEALDPDVQDVWFTGMRQFALPLAGASLNSKGELSIAPLRVGRRGNQYQSLIEVIISDESRRELHRGIVNFAFRSEKVINVH